ncbi:hypothetical protein MKW94_028534 [Papaver nudicaule]|uniref:DUF4283 domain-containing protein n=1 Tax=Papaver nudicaule TaxID=74823 RepID=A0AA41SCX7_PAPNU|nr:hypothetical protein [Papaver nudicaule]
MVTMKRSVDADGFMTQSRRRSRPIEENSKMSSDEKLRDRNNIKVERKIIGASMGKKGWKDVIHLAIWSGARRRFCWLSFKAGIWLVRILKTQANGGDGKLPKWNFREDEDWMFAIREKNEYGEYIRLQVSHNKTYPDTLFFPAGNNGVGWRDTGIYLESLLFSASHKKERKVTEKPVLTASNAWFGSSRDDYAQQNKGQIKLPPTTPSSDQGLDSIWQRTLVVEVAPVIDFEWTEVGKWITAKFGWSLGFELQPIDEFKAVFTVKTFAEFSRVRKIGNWKVGNVDVHTYPWFAGINAIHKPNPESLKKKWVGIKGVPYNLWNFSTFKIIGNKFGGLVDVCPETSMATDLTEIRVLVVGPVSNGVWCEEIILDNKGVWAEIRCFGEMLEPSRHEVKPVHISVDRMEPPPGFFWHRKSSPVTCNIEDEVRLRGNMSVVLQRDNNLVTNKAGCSQSAKAVYYGCEKRDESDRKPWCKLPSLSSSLTPTVKAQCPSRNWEESEEASIAQKARKLSSLAL